MDYDDGTAKYEFIGKLPNGKAFEVDVYTDGRVEEVEEEIDMNSIPPAVRATLNRFFPNLQPSKVEKSTRANLGVWYEFDAKDPRGRRSTSRSAPTASASSSRTTTRVDASTLAGRRLRAPLTPSPCLPR